VSRTRGILLGSKTASTSEYITTEIKPAVEPDLSFGQQGPRFFTTFGALQLLYWQKSQPDTIFLWTATFFRKAVGFLSADSIGRQFKFSRALPCVILTKKKNVQRLFPRTAATIYQRKNGAGQKELRGLRLRLERKGFWEIL